MAASGVRKHIVSSFKLNGLSLRSEASVYLTEVLSNVTEEDLDHWLDKIIEAVQRQPLSSSLIGRETVEAAVEECDEGGNEDSESSFVVIDAFSVPRLQYHKDRKKFLLDGVQPRLHGKAEDKANLFKERYNMIYQRTSRHELFTPANPGTSSSKTTNKFELKPVEYLLGSTAQIGKVIVLGLLTQIKEGRYHLEDPTGAVELDLSKAMFHNGLFTENCFVIAEGTYDDEVFFVSALGFPPSEPAKVTRNHFGSINFFGGSSSTCAKVSTKLQALEKENKDAMFVFLSDVWLDQPKVMEKLKVLFMGYSSMPPTVFVFCGNFTSTPYGINHTKILKDSFKALAEMLLEFPELVENSRFIFIPGAQDPGAANILPRPPIPQILTEDFRKKIPLSFFGTNPCRLQYCTQEIIIFREDLVNKMCRNCVHLPEDLGAVPHHLVKTILAQAYLCPLPLHVRPIYWNFDNGLRVYPVPDLIVLADKYNAYSVNSLDCACFNPGSFSRNDFAFKVYWPATKEVEDSKISE